MTEDEIRSLILLAGPAEPPKTGTELAELLGRGRRKRQLRGYLVMTGSAASTAVVAVLIVALAVGRSDSGAPTVPANQPVVPATSSSTIGTTPPPPPITTTPTTPTTAATGTHNPVRPGSTAATTSTTTTSGAPPNSSTAGTTTHRTGTTTPHP